MDYNQLTYFMHFVEVVESKNFSHAARKLHLSPSVVSKHMSKLEQQLGSRLFIRNTRKLSLTEAGQSLYERCLQIKQEIELATHEIHSIQDKPQGTLRINAPQSFGHTYLIGIVAEFMAAYPEIKVELVLGSHYSNLIENGLDLAIHIKDLPDSNYFARRLTARGTSICASPKYFEDKGMPQTPDELQQHNCLIYQAHDGPRNEWTFNADSPSPRIKVSGNLTANSNQALVEAAINNLGIIRVPSFMIESYIEKKQLIRILKEYCIQDMGIYAVYPDKRYLTPKVKVFLDFLVNYFSQ